MVDDDHGPSLHPALDSEAYRQILARRLREIRSGTGLTQKEMATKMYWSTAKQIRVEAGTSAVNPWEVGNLLKACDITDPATLEELDQLAHWAMEPSPLDKFAKWISPEFRIYLGFEKYANIVRNFESVLVPGLLQTEEYAEEVLKEIRAVHDEERINKLVELRLERQDWLFSRDDLGLHFILDESILRRPVGGRDLMKRQVDHLIEMSNKPQITIRVVPFTAGVYRSIRVPFVLLEFPVAAEPAVLFLEYPQGDEVLRGDEIGETKVKFEGTGITVPTYLEIFFELEQLSPRKASMELLQDASRNL
jgi:transcriptional regulator with XRE-family HTH domain